MKHFAIWSPNIDEKESILSQHRELYNGYQTLNPAAMEKIQPLYVQDFANDKDGLVVNNRGEVKKYTNMGINESINEKDDMCEQCGGTMVEEICEQCGSMKEQTNGQKLDVVKDIDPKAHVDYVEEDGEMEEQYDSVESAYDFESDGPVDVYGTMKDYDKEHPHHDYNSMEDVEKYDPSGDLSRMFDVKDGYAYRDDDSDTFQHDAGDVNRRGDAGLGMDTENDMDLGKSDSGYDFYSDGAEGGESYSNYNEDVDMESGEELTPSFDNDGYFLGMEKNSEDMEEDDLENLKEVTASRNQILEMMQRMKKFM